MIEMVRAFLARHPLSADAQPRYIDLVSEVGELGKELLKGSGYGQSPVSPTPDTEMELGDCLFSLLALAEALDIDATAALSQALDKYEARFSKKGTIGS